MKTKKPFLIRLVANPSLLWKAIASVVFISLAIAFLVLPSIMVGEVDAFTRYGFGGMLLAYGSFRLYMFYGEYRNLDDEE